MSCGGFEGCSCAGVVHEWCERRARLGEPVGVEGSIFVGFDVEEVGAADGEVAGGCGELDHLLWNVGGVCDGDCGGVAVFVWDHVAFLELAECGPFPGAARPVGDVLAVARCVCGVVVCVRGHLCFLFSLSFFFLPAGRCAADFPRERLLACLARRFPGARFSWPQVNSMGE